MKANSFACPNCGEMLPAKARVCSSCGSDENTGWSENTYMDGIDLPFEDDEYEEIKAKEFGGRANGRNKKTGVNWKAITGMAVVAAMLLAFVFRGC